MAPTTTLTRDSQRVRTTLPRDLARAIAIGERKARGDLAAVFEVDCPDGDELPVRFGFGPDAGDDPLARAVSHYASSGQTQLQAPLFVAAAWNLLDVDLRWPEAETVAADADEPVDIEATVAEWTPIQSVDPWDIAGESQRSTLTKTESSGQADYSLTVPLAVARQVGLTDARESARLRIGAACVGGRVVLTAQPDAEGESTAPNSLSVDWIGPQANQARVSGHGVASLLGVHGRLDDGPVGIRWTVNDGYAVAYVEESG